MRTLVIGAGKQRIAGAVHHDIVPLPGIDVVHNLEVTPWPWLDASFDYVLASHVMEHVHKVFEAMDEIWRILAIGGVVEVRVPHYKSENAFTDPTHVHFFTPKTLDYCVASTPLGSYLSYYTKHKYDRIKVEEYDPGTGLNLRFLLWKLHQPQPIQRFDG